MEQDETQKYKGTCYQIGCSSEIRCKRLCSYHYYRKKYKSKKKKKCLNIDEQGEMICKNKQRRRGLCSFHYNKLKRCKQGDCKALIYAENLCNKHFKQIRGHCVFGDCESTNIYCLKKMLCQYHYNREQYNKKRKKNDSEKKNLNEILLLLLKEDIFESRIIK